jgi:hypothetical protein
MTPSKAPLSVFVSINGKLLAAVLFGGLAFVCWPDTARDWRLGLLSILLGAGALGIMADALRLMSKIHARERTINAFIAQGRAASSSELASPDVLRGTGMTDE